MSVISRDDAKRIIDNIDTFCAGWRDYAKEKIDNAPTIDPVKWIPVTERLPEKSGRYLVQYGENSDYMQEILSYYTEEFIANIPKGWHSMDMWESLVDYAVDMIAWMPLPEPWKGEER